MKHGLYQQSERCGEPLYVWLLIDVGEIVHLTMERHGYDNVIQHFETEPLSIVLANPFDFIAFTSSPPSCNLFIVAPTVCFSIRVSQRELILLTINRMLLCSRVKGFVCPKGYFLTTYKLPVSILRDFVAVDDSFIGSLCRATGSFKHWLPLCGNHC